MSTNLAVIIPMLSAAVLVWDTCVLGAREENCEYKPDMNSGGKGRQSPMGCAHKRPILALAEHSSSLLVSSMRRHSLTVGGSDMTELDTEVMAGAEVDGAHVRVVVFLGAFGGGASCGTGAHGSELP